MAETISIRNVSLGTVNVAGRSIGPNRVADILTTHWHSWLKIGSNREIAAERLRVEVKAAPAPELVEDDVQAAVKHLVEQASIPVLSMREAAVDAAVRTLDSNDSTHWTPGGKPKLALVRQRSGLPDLNQAEVAVSWDRVNGGNEA